MLRRQSSGRNYRGKKLRPRHSFQAFLLLAVGIWIVYRLTRTYGTRRGVVVETGDGNEEARRRLGRKGFVGFAGRASSDDDDVVARDDDGGGGSQGAEWGAASSDDALSEAEEGGDGDEGDQAADEDDGGDDAGDAIAGEEEEEDDDGDFPSRSGNGEDELKIAFGEGDRATVFGNDDGDHGTRLLDPTELNSSAVLRAKATGSVQDAAVSQQRNATDRAADGRTSATDFSDSTLKNASSMNQSLNDRGSAGDAAKNFVVDGVAVTGAGAENKKHNVSVEDNRMINQNEIAGPDAGRGISS